MLTFLQGSKESLYGSWVGFCKGFSPTFFPSIIPGYFTVINEVINGGFRIFAQNYHDNMFLTL